MTFASVLALRIHDRRARRRDHRHLAHCHDRAMSRHSDVRARQRTTRCRRAYCRARSARQVKEGAPADLIITTPESSMTWSRPARWWRQPRRFIRSSAGVAVKRAPGSPDISTPEAFRNACWPPNRSASARGRVASTWWACSKRSASRMRSTPSGVHRARQRVGLVIASRQARDRGAADHRVAGDAGHRFSSGRAAALQTTIV